MAIVLTTFSKGFDEVFNMCGITHTREDHFWQFVHAISKFPLIHWLPIDGFSLVVRQWFRSVETNNLVVIITWQERCHQGEIGRNIFGNGTEPHQLTRRYLFSRQTISSPPSSYEILRILQKSGPFGLMSTFTKIPELAIVFNWAMNLAMLFGLFDSVQWIRNMNVKGLASY